MFEAHRTSRVRWNFRLGSSPAACPRWDERRVSAPKPGVQGGQQRTAGVGGELSFAEAGASGQVAPIPVVRGTVMEPLNR
jgi:hypothetical protein